MTGGAFGTGDMAVGLQVQIRRGEVGGWILKPKGAGGSKWGRVCHRGRWCRVDRRKDRLFLINHHPRKSVNCVVKTCHQPSPNWSFFSLTSTLSSIRKGHLISCSGSRGSPDFVLGKKEKKKLGYRVESRQYSLSQVLWFGCGEAIR